MAITDSILLSVKSLLDIQETDESFDQNLIMQINGVMMILNQLGVGPDTVYSITGATETWAAFLPDGDDVLLSLVKTYVMLKVKSTFDPTGSSVISSSLERLIAEYEERLIIQAE